MARNGPSDDFHEQATQHAGYGIPEQPTSGQPLTNPPEGSEQAEPVDSLDSEPTPWYRRPPLLIAWLVFVAILLALIVYGITALLQGGQGGSPTPSTSSTSSTTTTTATTTTTTTTPTSSSAVEEPGQQPTQQPSRQPSQQEPTHRHHLPSVPPVITIPGVPTVITVPPGLR